MSVSQALADAIEIFKELGWDKAEPARVMDLPIGTVKQQAAAKKGLTKGSWGSFRQTGKNTYGYVSDVGVDEAMLGAFAIRVGVSARRAVTVAPRWGQKWTPEIMGALLASRGPEFVTAFAAGGGAGFARVAGLFHAFAATRASAPKFPGWLTTWAYVTGQSLDPAALSRDDLIPIEIIEPAYADHLRTALHAPIQVPDRFDVLIGHGVASGWFDRGEALELAINAMDQAQRPSDRRAYATIVAETLNAERDWLLERAPILLAAMAQGPDPVVELFAPLLLTSGDEDLLSDALVIGLNAKSAKTKTSVIATALTIAPPARQVRELAAETVATLLGNKNRKLATQADHLVKAWALEVEPELEAPPIQARGLWRATPPLAPVPRFDPGPTTAEHVTELAAHLVADRPETATLDTERFLHAINALARTDVDAARAAVRGVRHVWCAGLREVEKWAKNEPINGLDRPDRYSAYPPQQAREASLFSCLGAVPCLLSTPTWDDFRIAPSDLADRLDAYAEANVAVLEADLQVALPRLDLAAVTDELAERLGGVSVPIALQDGTLATVASANSATASAPVTLTVGQVLTEWLAQPMVHPADDPAKSTFDRPDLVPALQHFPDRYRMSYGALSLTAFPLCANAPLPQRDALSAAIRPEPLGPVPATALLNLIHEDAVPLDATIAAWSCGVLLPGVPQAKELSWRGAITSLAARVQGWCDLADAGMLSVVWPFVDDVIAFSSSGPRLAPGVAELVEMLSRYLPEVRMAVESGVASPDALDLPGVRGLASRGGSSRTVKVAQALVDQLPPPTAGDAVGGSTPTMSDETFAEAWISVPDPAPIADGAVFEMEILDKTMHMFITDAEGQRWDVNTSAWFYDTINEIAVDGVSYTERTLRFDPETHTLRMMDKARGAAAQDPAPVISQTLILKALTGLLSPVEGATYYFYRLFEREPTQDHGLGPKRIGAAIDVLLRDFDADGYRLVRNLTQHPETLSIMYPAFTRSIRHAATVEPGDGKPPRWLPRLLDVALVFAPVLREAASRGLLTSDDATWPGLATIASSSKSPASRKKAAALIGALGLDTACDSGTASDPDTAPATAKEVTA